LYKKARGLKARCSTGEDLLGDFGLKNQHLMSYQMNTNPDDQLCSEPSFDKVIRNPLSSLNLKKDALNTETDDNNKRGFNSVLKTSLGLRI